MVKNLFKHEFMAWLRVVPLFFVIAPLASIAFQLLNLFEVENTIFSILLGLTAFTSIIALIPCIAAPIVFCVTRFYKNLFTGEGYLTLTLPVKTAHHIVVKVTVGAVFSAVSFIVAILSLGIFLGADVLQDLWSNLEFALLTMPRELRLHLPLYILEVVLLLIVGSFSNPLQYYSCICLGQLSKKNRILAAVGALFLYGLIAEVISFGFSTVMLLLADSELVTTFTEFAVLHPYAMIHVYLLFSLVLCLVLCGVYFLICNHILKKKLNLE